MTDTRDPRVAELVTRLVEQAPPAPPFPDEIAARPEGPRRRIAVVGVAVAAALVIASVVFVASRPEHHPAPVSPSTTTPTTTTGPTVFLPVVRPAALAMSHGSLFVADPGAHRIVEIADGAGIDVSEYRATLVARVQQPIGLAFGPDGLLYVADDGTHSVLRVEHDGRVTTYAGSGTVGFSGDGGPATRAQLNQPAALTFGPDGALYVADSGNGRIRRVAPDGTISTFAGNGSPSYTGDGGPAIEAGLDPTKLAFDGAGNLVVFQFDTKAIRRIAPDGIITSVESRYASALATRSDGNVLIADYGMFGISLLSPGGTVSNLPFQHSGVFRPVAIADAGGGDVYVADDGVSGGGYAMRIMRVSPDGTSSDITPVASRAPLTSTRDPRSAAGNVPYVESLVAHHKLPYAERIQSVRAEGDFMVVSTNLTDGTKAAELWEALSLRVGCDDSYLLVRGYHVILADGSVVAAPRPGFQYCAGT